LFLILRNNDGQKPTIVIDFLPLLFMSNSSNAIYGGSEHEDYQAMEIFLKELNDYADLVFFGEGPAIEDKQDCITDRINQKYDGFIEVCDGVNAGNPVGEICEKSKQYYNNFLTQSRVALAVIQKYGRFITSFSMQSVSFLMIQISSFILGTSDSSY
jgi:hypothetical protein